MKQHWMIIFQGFSFAFLIGLVIGMLIFMRPSDLIDWWENINWDGQGVANAGAWISGLATIPAAIFTGYSAFAASRAAKAAEESASQWRQQTAYDNLLDKAIHTHIHIKWIKSHLKNAFDKNSKFLHIQSKSKDEFFDDLIDACNSGWDDEYNELFMLMDSQLQKIENRMEDFFVVLDYTVELSKSITACDNADYTLVKECATNIIVSLPFIIKNFLKIKTADALELESYLNEGALIDIDAIFLTRDSSQHYLKSIINDLWIVEKYIEDLITSNTKDNWNKHVSEFKKINKPASRNTHVK